MCGARLRRWNGGNSTFRSRSSPELRRRRGVAFTSRLYAFLSETMMQEKLSFFSDGLKLSAVLHVPEGRKPGQRLPAFIVLHGFVGSKDESHAEIQARMLENM